MSIFSERLPDHTPQWLFDDQHKKLRKAYEKDSIPRLAQVSSIISPLANKVNETSVLHQFIKIIKYSVSYIAILWENLKAREIVHYANVFSDTIKTLGIVNGIKTILENGAVKDLKGIELHERNIAISHGVLETISGGFSFINLLDHFNLLGIADLSLSIGSLTLLPLRVIGDGIELLKGGMEIANRGLRIYETNHLKTKIKAKKKQFSLKDSGDIEGFLKTHLLEMEQKQTDALANIKAMELHIQDTHDQTDLALQAYMHAEKAHKNNKTAIKISSWLKLHRKESDLFAVKKEHDQVTRECEALRSKFEARALKWTVWNALENHHTALIDDHNHQARLDIDGNLEKFTIDAEDPLSRLIKHKKEKWKIQLNNCSWSNAIDGIGISLHTVMATTVIASSILAMTGIGTIPALIAMASMSLIVSFGGLALELLEDYRNPHDVPQTDFDDYMPDPTRFGFSIHPHPTKRVYI